MRLSRRSFIAWLAGVAAAARWRPRRAHATTLLDQTGGGRPAQPRGVLSPAMVAALADVMLPSELGADGVARVSGAFTTWLAGYRQGAEIVHPYGSPRIAHTGASPATRWREQLGALDRAARDAHHRPFVALSRPEREALVRSALSAERLDRLPDPLAANHIAVALASFYFTSPDANDLCYRARIGRQQCRPLVNAPREPLPLAPSRRS